MPAARSWAEGMLTERNLRIASETAAIAAGLGTSPASVALAWAARQPGVTAVITGPRTLGQMRDNLEAFSLVLPPDALARLSDISGPLTPEPVTGTGAHH
jgi:aryl-alcohol dehydrogenase-like predicted oxidoreductase